VTQLAVAAVLAGSQPGDENDVLPMRQVAVNAAIGAGVAGCVALTGCRAAFYWSGPAGRGKLLWQLAAAKMGVKNAGKAPPAFQPPPPCCFRLCDCKFDPYSTELRRRVRRSAVGWAIAFGVYLIACAVTMVFVAGSTLRKFVTLIGTWALAQGISWAVVEPVGVLLFMCAATLLRRQAQRHQARKGKFAVHPE